MRAQREKQTTPGANRGGETVGVLKAETGFSTAARRSNQQLVAAIDTGHASQVRVHLSRWRGQTKLELKPYSATVPQCFMPCGPGVSIDITKVDELIAALIRAKAAT